MSSGARLTAIDALPFFKAALQLFASEATAALTELDMELSRAADWIEHDCPDGWKRQIRISDERVAELRIALERAVMFKSMSGEPAPCHDERKAMALAKRRRETAEEKLEIVRRWRHVVEREILEFRAIANQLAGWLQADFPKAVNMLERMRSALETYVAIESPAEAPRPPAMPSADAVAPPDAGAGARETAPPAAAASSPEEPSP